MTAEVRSDTSSAGFTDDFHRVRDFLVRINQEAKVAFVTSDQQFYHSIGFVPYSSGTWWETDSGDVQELAACVDHVVDRLA